MGKLSDEFFMPPFSVLNAREGIWQKRKKEWISLGIKSELGRGECITWTGDAITEPGLNHYRNKNGLLADSEQARSHYKGGSVATNVNGRGLCDTLAPRPNKGLARCFGQDLMKGENAHFRPNADLPEKTQRALGGYFANGAVIDRGEGTAQSGTSIFDPVLCELVYRWFCPPGGHVLDPFAGGSVRGIVAAHMGFKYTGIDLSGRQIEANRNQATTNPDIKNNANCQWIVGDSRAVNSLCSEKHDLIFSCPPYADLEVYSDDPRDLSTLEYPAFLKAYAEIIKASLLMLKPNRFACFVVGDIRDKQGFYRGFVSDTIHAFQNAGATLYNEAILVTAVGSLPIRVRKQFSGYRKLGKTHQNVLIFYKGDIKAIKEEFGDVDLGKTFDQADLGAWV